MRYENQKMKKLNFVLLILFINLTVFGQDNETYYKQAIDEITAMLEDKQPISFKRAVFLTENAYFDGKLDYNHFCNQIEQAKASIYQMIANKGLQGYKTAGNWAIFTYITKKVPENGNCKIIYDYDSMFNFEDMRGYMVSSLMDTKKGNCHSMPYYYKILADEVGVEAFVALAPLHVFVKHRDEQGKWWNLELTTGTFARTSFMIESFKVTDAGMASGLYMKPLDGKELLTVCLSDLIGYYHKKTGIYYGELVHKACDAGIKHNKASELQLWKADAIKYDLAQEMQKKGLTNTNQLAPYPKLFAMKEEMKETFEYIHEMGYYEMLPQDYRQRIEDIKNGKYEKYQK